MYPLGHVRIPEAEGRLSAAAGFLALELAVGTARWFFCGALSWVTVTYCGVVEWTREID